MTAWKRRRRLSKEKEKKKMVILNCEAINAVLLAVSKDPVRFFLQGVHIEDKDDIRIYTACDGYILLRVKTPLNADEERLDKSYILKIEKPFGKKSFKASFVVVDEEIAVLTSNLEAKAAKILDAQYPDVSRVIPADDTPAAKEYAIFDPDLMKKVNTFLGGKGYKPQMQDAQSPALWVKENRTAVLMPMRCK